MRPEVAKESPHVGIFWLIKGKVIIYSASLNDAEDCGDFKIHPRSHEEVWSVLQKSSDAPTDVEYEEAPRGRVMYDTKTQRFTLLDDRCILRDRDAVRKIKQRMHLPKNTTISGDSHYQCSLCLHKRGE